MAPQIYRNLIPALVLASVVGTALTTDAPFGALDTAPKASGRAVVRETVELPVAERAVAEPQTAEEPQFDIRGGDDEIRAKVEKALARFDDAGLDLPQLVIEFHDDAAHCNGHEGLFVPGTGISRVELCTTETFIIFHELGHAWELSSMTDEERAGFLDATGLPTWDDRSTPWADRGREVVANTIATGLAYRELTPMTVEQFETELALYELLTGGPSPRIAG